MTVQKRITVLGVMLFGILTAASAQRPASWYFDEASKIHISGKTDTAIKLLEEGVGHWPYNPLIRDLLAQLRKQKKDQDKNQNQDQDQDKKQDQNKQDQEKQNQQDQQKPEQQKQQQQQQQQRQMSKADAERILEVLKNNEKEVQRKLRQQKAAGRPKAEKDW
ncbi:MAG: hypothetical protein HY961_12120 [Ignavibacteriae bacterium]|nr:hypothetical protein [Ignavibacteriota bacterium]